jgi:hypothetical protein
VGEGLGGGHYGEGVCGVLAFFLSDGWGWRCGWGLKELIVEREKVKLQRGSVCRKTTI